MRLLEVYLKLFKTLHAMKRTKGVEYAILGVPKTTVLDTSRSGATRTAMVARQSGPAEDLGTDINFGGRQRVNVVESPPAFLATEGISER